MVPAVTQSTIQISIYRDGVWLYSGTSKYCRTGCKCEDCKLRTFSCFAINGLHCLCVHIRVRAGWDALFKLIFAVMTKSQSTSYTFKTHPTVMDILGWIILSIIERLLLIVAIYIYIYTYYHGPYITWCIRKCPLYRGIRVSLL